MRPRKISVIVEEEDDLRPRRISTMDEDAKSDVSSLFAEEHEDFHKQKVIHVDSDLTMSKANLFASTLTDPRLSECKNICIPLQDEQGFYSSFELLQMMI